MRMLLMSADKTAGLSSTNAVAAGRTRPPGRMTTAAPGLESTCGRACFPTATVEECDRTRPPGPTTIAGIACPIFPDADAAGEKSGAGAARTIASFADSRSCAAKNAFSEFAFDASKAMVKMKAGTAGGSSDGVCTRGGAPSLDATFPLALESAATGTGDERRELAVLELESALSATLDCAGGASVSKTASPGGTQLAVDKGKDGDGAATVPARGTEADSRAWSIFGVGFEHDWAAGAGV